MKKLIAIAIVVALLISLIAAIPSFAKSQPAGGRAVFESDIIDTLAGSCELDKGEVWIRGDGSFKIEIEGDFVADDYAIWLWDLTDYGFYNLDTITISEDAEVILLTGYLYDYGIPNKNIAPIIEVFTNAGMEFMSGFYSPPAP